MHQKSKLEALFLSGLSRPISFVSDLIMILNRLCYALDSYSIYGQDFKLFL